MSENNKKKAPFNDDNSRKSLDNLIDNLIKLQKESFEREEKASCSSKQAAPKSKLRSPCNTRKRFKTDDNHPKITDWLTKENKSGESSKKKKREERGKALKPLDITVNQSKEKSKSKKVLERTPSFEKYGIVLPTYQQILENQKKTEELKAQLEAFDALKAEDSLVLKRDFKIIDCTEKKHVNLDCKRLSLDDLKEKIDKHLDTLRCIMNGEEYSERHELFHNYDVKYTFTSKDLRCCPSFVVFTQEQKEYMLDSMRELLDPENERTNDYFFKVMLPELCLLVFMDVHAMGKEEANKYLKERPVDV